MRGLAGYDAPFGLAAMGVVFDPGTLLAAFSIGGSLLSAGGAIISGNQQEKAGVYQAHQLETKAIEERAAASREAAEQAKKQALVMSRQQALAAASGGSATDPTILDLMGDTAAQGFQQRGTTIALGENKARGYKDAAAMARYNGRMARRGGQINALSSLIAAPSAAFQAYGYGTMPTGYK